MSADAAPVVRVERLSSDAFRRITLESPPGNILDARLTTELTTSIEALAADRSVKAVVLASAGADFCFGASVQEHLADQVAGMLQRFHGLILTIARSGLILLPAVRGRCLGGGLELASFGQRVFSARDASFGQPEIALAVFAPIASLVLPERIGRAAADDLLLSGRSVNAQEARALGLVDELSDAPEQAALEWAERNLLAHSAAALRLATRAARFDSTRRLEESLAGIERIYLDELMQTRDATEGLEAFLEKRKPDWRDT